MQYGFSKPILVKVVPGITAVERVKQEKLKSLNTKIKSLSLNSLLHVSNTILYPPNKSCSAQLYL